MKQITPTRANNPVDARQAQGLKGLVPGADIGFCTLCTGAIGTRIQQPIWGSSRSLRSNQSIRGSERASRATRCILPRVCQSNLWHCGPGTTPCKCTQLWQLTSPHTRERPPGRVELQSLMRPRFHSMSARLLRPEQPLSVLTVRPP